MKLSSRHVAPVVFSILAMAVSIGVQAAPAPAAPAAPAGSTDKDKVSYAIGMKFAAEVDEVKGDLDPAIVMRAFTTSVTGGKPTMSIPDAQATLQAFGKKVMARRAAQAQAKGQKNLADGNAFLAANAKKPGVKTTASGLQYQVMQAGTGPKPKATDTVKVNYRGTLLDGSEFDSSAKNGGPASFQVSGVIPGWTEGLQLMNTGSKFVFWVPGKLAYGDSDRGPGGPNSMLKFEVELLSVGK